MTHPRKLQSISDDELLRGLSDLLRQSRRVESEIVAHIGEVDQRRLFASQACSSMFIYVTKVLHLSEHEAYLRIAVAQASRKFPVLLEMLADGRLHLSGIDKLAPHLSEANCKTLLARAAHKSKRDIEELVADLAPRLDVPTSMPKLPTPSPKAPPSVEAAELGPDPVVSLGVPTSVAPREVGQPAPRAPRGVVEPLGSARYRIQFTASASLRDKLERPKALLRSSVPDGDLGAIIEEAVTEKLERLEAKRFAETKTRRKTVEQSDFSPGSRHIPVAVKRVVRARDADQCTFVDDQDRGCTERRGLEFHHDHPFGVGGDRSLENIRLTCRSHNLYLAELDYGKRVMARYRRDDESVSEPAPVYGAYVQPAARVDGSALLSTTVARQRANGSTLEGPSPRTRGSRNASSLRRQSPTTYASKCRIQNGFDLQINGITERGDSKYQERGGKGDAAMGARFRARGFVRSYVAPSVACARLCRFVLACYFQRRLGLCSIWSTT